MNRRFALISFLLVTAAASFAGTTYKLTTVAEAEGARATTRLRGWASGGHVKLVFEESENPATPPESYLLRNIRSSALYLVTPAKKTYSRWNLAQALAASSSSMKVSDARFEKVAEEPGGKIAGFDTTHHVFRLTYTMTSEVFGSAQETPTVVEQEYWVSDDKTLAEIKSGNLLQPNSSLPLFDSALQRTITEQTAAIQGTPLKTVVRFTMGLSGGHEQTTAISTEVSDVNTAATVPASMFRIPAGYRLLPSPAGKALASKNGDKHQH